MRKLFIVTIPALFILLACGMLSSSGSPAPTGVSAVPTASDAPTAMASSISTASPGMEVTAPQQWTGTLRDVDGSVRVISLIINKTDGNTFNGNLYWAPVKSYSLVITAVHGDIITNVDGATEQNRWGFLQDFKDGNKGGVWLRWTETENIKGCCVILNGWYYAHIRSDGHLVGIFFRNAKVENPDNASYDLTLDITPTPTP